MHLCCILDCNWHQLMSQIILMCKKSETYLNLLLDLLHMTATCQGNATAVKSKPESVLLSGGGVFTLTHWYSSSRVLNLNVHWRTEYYSRHSYCTPDSFVIILSCTLKTPCLTMFFSVQCNKGEPVVCFFGLPVSSWGNNCMLPERIPLWSISALSKNIPVLYQWFVL